MDGASSSMGHVDHSNEAPISSTSTDLKDGLTQQMAIARLRSQTSVKAIPCQQLTLSPTGESIVKLADSNLNSSIPNSHRVPSSHVRANAHHASANWNGSSLGQESSSLPGGMGASPMAPQPIQRNSMRTAAEGTADLQRSAPGSEANLMPPRVPAHQSPPPAQPIQRNSMLTTAEGTADLQGSAPGSEANLMAKLQAELEHLQKMKRQMEERNNLGVRGMPPRSPTSEGLGVRGMPPMSPASEGLGIRGMPPTSEGLGIRGMPPTSEGLGIRGMPPTSEGQGIRGMPPTSEGSDVRGMSPRSPTSEVRGMPPMSPTSESLGVRGMSPMLPPSPASESLPKAPFAAQSEPNKEPQDFPPNPPASRLQQSPFIDLQPTQQPSSRLVRVSGASSDGVSDSNLSSRKSGIPLQKLNSLISGKKQQKAEDASDSDTPTSGRLSRVSSMRASISASASSRLLRLGSKHWSTFRSKSRRPSGETADDVASRAVSDVDSERQTQDSSDLMKTTKKKVRSRKSIELLRSAFAKTSKGLTAPDSRFHKELEGVGAKSVTSMPQAKGKDSPARRPGRCFRLVPWLGRFSASNDLRALRPFLEAGGNDPSSSQQHGPPRISLGSLRASKSQVLNECVINMNSTMSSDSDLDQLVSQLTAGGWQSGPVSPGSKSRAQESSFRQQEKSLDILTVEDRGGSGSRSVTFSMSQSVDGRTHSKSQIDYTPEDQSELCPLEPGFESLKPGKQRSERRASQEPLRYRIQQESGREAGSNEQQPSRKADGSEQQSSRAASNNQQQSSRAAGSSEQQSSRAAGSSEQQSSRAAGSSEQQSSRAAGSSEQQSSRAAGSSEQQSSSAAGSSEQQSSSAAGSSEQQSSRAAGSSEQQSSRAASSNEQQSSRAAGSSEQESSRAAGSSEQQSGNMQSTLDILCRKLNLLPPTLRGQILSHMGLSLPLDSMDQSHVGPKIPLENIDQESQESPRGPAFTVPQAVAPRPPQASRQVSQVSPLGPAFTIPQVGVPRPSQVSFSPQAQSTSSTKQGPGPLPLEENASAPSPLLHPSFQDHPTGPMVKLSQSHHAAIPARLSSGLVTARSKSPPKRSVTQSNFQSALIKTYSQQSLKMHPSLSRTLELMASTGLSGDSLIDALSAEVTEGSEESNSDDDSSVDMLSQPFCSMPAQQAYSTAEHSLPAQQMYAMGEPNLPAQQVYSISEQSLPAQQMYAMEEPNLSAQQAYSLPAQQTDSMAELSVAAPLLADQTRNAASQQAGNK
eukprot:gene31520-6703_t